MNLSAFYSRQRRVDLVQEVASETYVDPSIAQAFLSPSPTRQLQALENSGASANELRVAGNRLEERGSRGGTVAVAVGGSLVSLTTGWRSKKAIQADHSIRGGIWLLTAIVAGTMTLGALLNRRASRKMAPVLLEAASLLDTQNPSF